MNNDWKESSMNDCETEVFIITMAFRPAERWTQEQMDKLDAHLGICEPCNKTFDEFSRTMSETGIICAAMGVENDEFTERDLRILATSLRASRQKLKEKTLSQAFSILSLLSESAHA
jgi:hypothetical protein